MADAVTDDGLEYYRRLFSEFRDVTATAREDSRMDERYYHGKQLTDAQRAALAKRKQPDSIFNRIRPAINGTLGVLAQHPGTPRAYGRNEQDNDSADVASKVLRFISGKVKLKRTRMLCAKDYFIAGAMAALVGADEDGMTTVDRIMWDEFFYDPRSKKEDFSDARYMGVAKWVFAASVMALYPDKVPSTEGLLSGNLAVDSTFEDRPTSAPSEWMDRKQSRVLLVEIYHNDGRGWTRCVFTGAGVLEKGPSPYQDSKGRPCNPIVAQSCYIDEENQRYGIARDMRGPQDEINKRRQKLLHILNSRQIQSIPQQEGAAMATDADSVREEAGRPDGVLPPGWQPVSTSDMASGQASLLAESKSEIERMGPNPAILGRQGEDSSGRALLTRQQAGMTEQALVFDGIEDWEHRIWTTMWDRARQFWTAAAFVRVTDDEQAPQYIGINQPVYGEPMVGMDPATGMATIQQPILGYRNRLAELDVDIEIEATPNSPTYQHEQFLALIDLAKSGVPIPPMILVEASSLPGKRQLMEKLKEAMSQPDPMAEVRHEGALADIEKTRADAAYKGAKATSEMLRTDIEAASAVPPGFGLMPAAEA